MTHGPGTPSNAPGATVAAVTLRECLPEDLAVLWRWQHAEPDPEWRRWDGPYFHEGRSPSALTLDEFVARAASAPPPAGDQRVVAVHGACVGIVTRAWEAPASGGWLEVGIVLFDPRSWGGGIGTRALTQWVDACFRETNAHVVTLTTWSGNERMLRAGARVGFRECSRVREARAWQNARYDSVRMDLLRREWNAGVTSAGQREAG